MIALTVSIRALWLPGGDGEACANCGDIGFLGSIQLHTQIGESEPRPAEAVLCQSCSHLADK